MDWHESALIYGDGSNITALRHDTHKRLVWVGYESGVVRSFYGPRLLPYTSFQAHNARVEDIQVTESTILSLSREGLRCHKRTGLLKSHVEHAAGTIMLLFDGEVLIGGPRRVNKFMLEPQIIETGTFALDDLCEEGVTLEFMARASPNIVLGFSSGKAQVVDSLTFESVIGKSLTCHTGPLTDLDCRKNILMTCGLSARRYGMVPDIVVFVYDTRLRRNLPMLSVSSGASFVRVHPKAPNHCVVAGSMGQLTFLDSKNPANIIIKQAAIRGEIIQIDIAPMGDGLVLAERTGDLHYWSKNASATGADSFDGLEKPTPVGPLPLLSEDSPLSIIGMPYYTQELLSSWSDPRHIFDTGMPTPNWELYPDGNLAVEHGRLGRRDSIPRFISQGGATANSVKHYTNDDVGASAQTSANGHVGRVPKCYRHLTIHYSRFGVDDFDFGYYNATKYSGLETLPSANANAVIQLLRWCAPLYNQAMNIFSRHNDNPKLLATGELATLIDMLQKAAGKQCRASNFADIVLPDAPIEPAELVRHLLEALIGEENETLESSGFENELTVPQSTRMYGSCGFRNDIVRQLVVPVAKAADVRSLSASLAITSSSMDWCSKCAKEHTMACTRQVSGEPQAIFFELEDSPKEEVCTRFQLGLRSDKHTYRLGAVMGNVVDASKVYDLKGYIAEIKDDGCSHSVAVVNVPDAGWHVFNDFCVAPITEAEALDFSPRWKRAKVLLYARPAEFDYEGWKAHLNTNLLYNPAFISGNLEAPMPAKMLEPGDDVPTVVALDAEFVLIDQEVAELHSDGTKSLLRPQTLSLARMSVLRGLDLDKPLSERIDEAVDDHNAFIDDFVETTKPVINYLTAYSGIEPGDLDPTSSPYPLVSRQTPTRRLWILLNLGCIFVGHALTNDFRTINLCVPPKQVVDTVDLFRDEELNGQRRLSLKFLMWAVLGEEIQLGNHDSVEDALSALRLYERYRELEAAGMLEKTLADVYAKGQMTNFRVPLRIS